MAKEPRNPDWELLMEDINGVEEYGFVLISAFPRGPNILTRRIPWLELQDECTHQNRTY